MLRKSPIKRKVKSKTAEARRYHEHIASLGCLVCHAPATVHHVTASIHGGRLPRSDYTCVPLCPTHHQIQFGPRESVEALSHKGFHAMYGIDLEKEATRLSAEWLI